MMNEMQDKQYLALELTKIKYQTLPEKVKRGDIMSDYRYFLNDLTGVLDKVEQIEELERENEKLQGLIRIQVEKEDCGATKLHRLIDVINQCKGDMEPYVYECLMAEIQMKIQ